MNKRGIISLLIIILLVVTAVFYFDIFNLQYSQEAVIASILNYEDTRRASGKLIEKISNPDPEIRKKATMAIGRIGDLTKIESLFSLLNDSVPEVAEVAAFGIGLLGKGTYAQRLLNLSYDFHPELQAACVQSVGRLADSTMTDVIDGLSQALIHLDHRVREQAAYAIWRANGKSAVPQLIEMCQGDPVRPVKIAALFSLVRMEIAEPTDVFQSWLPDADPYVRALALRGLSLGKDETMVQLIASGLNDRDNKVVSQAISSLYAINSPEAIEYLKARYTNTSDEKLKVQLLNTFTRLDNEQIADYVHEDLYSDSSKINIVAAAIVYLATVEKESAIPLIDTLLQRESSYLKSNIGGALKAVGGENVKPRLNALFRESVPIVRASAFDALCTVDSGNVEYYINTALADNDYVVVSMAIDKVGELKKEGFLPQLMTLIEMDPKAKIDIKRSIVGAVSHILEAEKDSLAEEILFRALMDKNYIVSKGAAQVYKDVFDKDKSAFINLPKSNFSERKLRGLLSKYKENPKAVVRTNRGNFEFELYFDTAPLTTANFIKLANDGFYNNIIFHRVVPNFVIQGGEPRGDGWGDPGYEIRCEYSSLPYERGSVGIATSGKDTGGSQFFVTHSPQTHLDGRYTLFGKVYSGMETVDNICRGDTVYSVQIIESEKK